MTVYFPGSIALAPIEPLALVAAIFVWALAFLAAYALLVQ